MPPFEKKKRRLDPPFGFPFSMFMTCLENVLEVIEVTVGSISHK